MRINHLNLSRYGHFTDYSIDFGKANKTHSDLHIIYGPNEAGKSTTLAAIVDLLYGMPAQSKYAFTHNYQALAIVAQIEQNQHQIELHRFKNKLLDKKGQPLPATAIDTHGLNREDFKSRFSFDEETLKEGGESILQNNGDLGAALFAATSGIADFSQALSKLMHSANAFYEPGKKKDKSLYQLKDELKEIDDKLKQLDINASAWAKKVEQANTLKSHYEEFQKQARANQLQLDTLKTKQRALRTAKRIKALHSNINALPSMPGAPETWLSATRDLNKQLYSLNVQSTRHSKQIEDLKAQKSRINVDTQLLIHSDTIEKLRNDKTLFEKRTEDIDALIQDNKDISSQQIQLMAQMGITDSVDASSYILTEPLAAQLTALQRTHEQYKSTLSAAEKELTSTKHELNVLGYVNDNDNEAKIIDLDALNNCISLVQDNALAARHKQLLEQQIDTQSQLEQNLNALNPWRGNAKQLMEQKTPSAAHIQTLQTQLTQISHDIAVSQSGIDSLLEESNDVETQEGASNALPENTLESGRKERDTLIKTHLHALDEELPHAQLHKSAREIALQQQHLDMLTDQHIAQVLKQEQTNATQSRLGILAEKIKNLQSKLTAQREKKDALAGELSVIASELQLAERSSAQELLNWLGLRDVATADAIRLNKLENEIKQISEAIFEENSRLKALMNSVAQNNHAEIDAMIDSAEILGLAQSISNKQRNINVALQQAQDNHTTLSKKLDVRQTDFSSAQKEYQQWQDSWNDLLKPTWIETNDPTLVGSILEKLAQLSVLQSRLEANERQLNKLNAEQDTYVNQANDVLKNLDVSTELSISERLNTLFKLNAINIETNATLNKISEQIHAAKTNLQSTQNELLPVTEQLNKMSIHCQVNDPVELEQRLEKINEKRSKLSQAQDFEQELLSTLNVSSIDEAMAMLTEVDEHELPALISQQELDVQSDTNMLNRLHHEYRTIQDPIDQFHADTNVAQLKQQRQSLLLKIEDQAMQTMRTRLGKLALEQGLRHFRDQRRSSMLENAKNAFTVITCGNYIDLRTQPGKQGTNEDLVGIRDTGQSKLAIDMSSGTRAQLYLALRIAAYEDYCKARTPLPFIADDIMETFDENRTEATLGLLNDMGQHGQIIYLTHHRHVVDIARANLGKNAKVHELPANPLHDFATESAPSNLSQ